MHHISVNKIIMEQPRNSPRQRTHSQKLPQERILVLQKITRTPLFYAKAIDLKILVALGTIAAAQNSGTTETENAMHKLLDYCAIHHNDTMRYRASRAQLRIIFVRITSKKQSRKFFLRRRSKLVYQPTKWINYFHINHHA